MGASLDDAAIAIEVSRDGGGGTTGGHAISVGALSENDATGGLTVGRSVRGGEGDRRVGLTRSRGGEGERREEGGEEDQRGAGELHYDND